MNAGSFLRTSMFKWNFALWRRTNRETGHLYPQNWMNFQRISERGGSFPTPKKLLQFFPFEQMSEKGSSSFPIPRNRCCFTHIYKNFENKIPKPGWGGVCVSKAIRRISKKSSILERIGVP